MEMNSEPSGTDEEIDDGKTAIDIFILCKDDRDSQQIIGQLTPPGYRITLFTDSTDLLESLRSGKPNLLICDTAGEDQDGYNVCREIKQDVDLWRIPVLLVTGIANLGDLLIVLDSNADNFIARPYDPQYLLSLVDLMLTSPVEKPDPEKIRTQFKIRHDDRDYVITADRRKLLEFLLSSFEMAVGRASELRQTERALDGLKSTLERRVAERTTELSTETARLQTIINGQTQDLGNARSALTGQKNEMDALRSRLEERETVINGTKDELARLTLELENTRARLAETEDTVHTLATEKDELEHALRGDAETMNRDLEQTRTDLTAAKKELADISLQREALETQLAALTHEHEESERALGGRSIEIEQLKSALASEKNRADTAGQEVKSVLMEKARSEQDLRKMVEDITEKATQQSQECLRLTDELTSEKERLATVGQQYSELTQETAKKEAAFVAQTQTLRERHDTLQQKYDALTESIGAERQKSATFEADIARITAAKEQVTGEMQELKEQLDATIASLEEEKSLRADAETSATELTKRKDVEMQALNSTISALRQDLEAVRASLVTAEQERDAGAVAHKTQSEALAAAELAKVQSDKLAHSAASELEQVCEELETERRLHHAADEKLLEITQVKENIEQTLNAASKKAAINEHDLLAKIQALTDTLNAEQEARRLTGEKLLEATRVKESIEQNLNAAREQTAAHERELLAKIQDLTDGLNAEQAAHRSTEEKLREAALAKENIERNLNTTSEQTAAHERELLAKIQDLTDGLNAEQEAHRLTEEKLATAARVIEQAEQNLQAITNATATEDSRRKDELKTALDRQRSLEEQLRQAEREQAEKESALQSLAAEIEQAGATLTAEKERRRAAEEACAEAKDALATLKRKTQPLSATIEEISVQHHVIVTKGPELPRVIIQEPLALSRKEIDHPLPVVQPSPGHHEMVKTAAEIEEPQVRIHSMEDLFEEAKELDVRDLPDATPIEHVSGNTAGTGMFEPAVNPVAGATGNTSGEPDIKETNVDEPEESVDIAREEETPSEDTDEAESESTSIEDQSYQGPNIGSPAFSRQQWFDLMKWAHNAETLSRADRMRIVKLGRLLQQGRRMTGRQEAQLEELVTLAYARGYRPKE